MAKDYAILFDATTCISCEACTVACKDRYETPRGYFRTKMQIKESGSYPQSVCKAWKMSCQHCADAACMQACPAGAISRVDGGAVVTDQDKCIGCGYCVTACPFGAAQFDRQAGKADKCSLCYTTASQREPFCVAVCPVGALEFGTRDEMKSRGNTRLAFLQSQGVNQARIYGDDEMGGLRVFTVLGDTPTRYGMPLDPQVPWGVRVWSFVFRPLGGIAALAAIGALWMNWTSTKSVKSTNPVKEAK